MNNNVTPIEGEASPAPVAHPPSGSGKKPLWAAIGILGAAVIALTALLMTREAAPPLPAPEPELPAAMEPKPPEEPAAESVQVGREPFGPQVSPDGRWILVEDSESVSDSEGIASVRHRLIARSLVGLGERVLYEVTQTRSASPLPVEESRLAADWSPAGWSADGNDVYYVVKDALEGLGGYYPSFVPGADRLQGVDVATGMEDQSFEPKSHGVEGAIRDVDAAHGLVAWTRLAADGKSQELVVSGLNGADGRMLMTLPAGSGIASAVFDPTGSRIAVVTYSLPGENYVYRLRVIDVATGATKDVPAPGDREWLFRLWSGPDAVRVTAFGETWEEIEIDIP